MAQVAAVPVPLPAARAARLWLLPALALPAAVAGIVLLAVHGRLPAASDEAWLLTVLPLLAPAGAGLLQRAPGHRLGQLLVLVGTWSAVALLARGWTVHAQAAADPVPGGLAAAWVGGWAWALTAVPLVTLLPLLVPDGRLPSRAWLPVPVAAGTSVLLLVAANALAPGDLPEWPGTANPLGLPAPAAGPLAAAGAVGALLVPLCALAAAAGLVTRWRRSSGPAREPLRLIALSSAPLAATVVWSTVAPSGAATLTAVVSFVVLCACTAAAATRQRLFELDVAVSRTAVWTGVVAVLLALHVGLVSLLDDVGGGSLVATAVVAVLFAPLRDLAQRRANAFLFGRRDDPWSALSQVGRRVEAAGHPQDALDEVAVVLRDALRLAAVQVLVADGAAAAQDPGADSVTGRWREQPLVHLGERVGALRVAPRAGEELGRRDLALLAELAPAVAVVVAGVLGAERLRRAQQELVTAVEEERRRLRRDLHDGVGPTLTGVAFALEAARNVVAERPAEALALLDGTTRDLQSALKDLRHAVEGLRPPALDDLGLVAALRERLRALGDAGVDLRLHLPDALPALPAAVEVAAYRIVLEGVSNVLRHARARTCDVRLAVDADGLRVEVEDDGCGPPQPLRLGTGLLSVRERAEALGGRAQVLATGRGSLLQVVLPVPT